MKLFVSSRLLPLVIVLVLAGGCGGARADKTAATATAPEAWQRMSGAPSIAGMEAVPKGMAVEVENRGAGKEPSSRALVVPEAGTYRVEQFGAAGTSVTVLTKEGRYLFIPGDGVVLVPQPTSSQGPTLEWAYEQAYGQAGVASFQNLAWERRGETYRGRGTISVPEAPASTVELTIEIDRDPTTGIALRERVTTADSWSGDPFAHLGLTLERVRAALVPLQGLTDEDLAPAPGYLGEDLP